MYLPGLSIILVIVVPVVVKVGVTELHVVPVGINKNILEIDVSK